MNFQSGKTQAIDLDELNLDSPNRPSDYKARDDFELDKWGDDPWNSTEESRKRRRWAEDDKWAGDGEDQNQKDTAEKWDASEDKLKEGWKAPKRGDQLETSEGWDDWDNFDGGPKKLDDEMESKDFGGHRRVQAASQYASEDTSNYVDGRQNRDALYREKEVYGTAGLKERRGGPSFQQEMPSGPMPEMQEVGGGWDTNDAVMGSASAGSSAEDDVKAATISNVQCGDDIPGVTRASIILFQADCDPVVCELKKTITTIGRATDNMVIVNDRYTSRHHIRINYNAGKFEMVAVSQDNLTTVNTFPATHVILKSEDQIEIGATRIKFVVGPVSDIHMQLTPPKNGAPFHIGPMPNRVRSPKTTRKNLIILIASVATILAMMTVCLFAMVLGDKEDEKPQIAEDTPKAKQAVDEKTIEAEKPQVQEVPTATLEESDNKVIMAMTEGIGLALGQSRGTPAKVTGKRVQFNIDTTPSGARIYNADGTLRGVTPYACEEQVSADRTEKWTIRLDDYQDVVKEVSMKAGLEEKITLVKDESIKPPAKKAAPAKKSSSGGSKKSGGGKKQQSAPSRGGRRLLL